MNRYQRGKQKAREKAIEWQIDYELCSYAWEDIARFGSYFSRLTKRYGLIREFKQNGII